MIYRRQFLSGSIASHGTSVAPVHAPQGAMRSMKLVTVFLALATAALAQPKIALVGDSTQTDNVGYGRGFCANLTSAVDCLNFARGGASTKTFRQLGLWDKALAAHPDYMLIQFGHNDEVSSAHNDREVPIPAYQDNLRAFVREARAAHAAPVLITPLTRRYFGADGKIHSDLTAYCDAMKAVAAELDVPLIDLQSRSIAYLDSVGEQAGNKLGITKKDKDGNTVPDKTHLDWQGSYVFGRMVAEDLGKVEPALAKYVQPAPAPLPAEGRLAMRVIATEPFTVSVEGNSSLAAGFCKTVTPNVTCSAGASNAQYSILVNAADRQRISAIRAGGAIPILAAIASSRDSADSLRKLAGEDHVTFVDLHSQSDKDPAVIGRLFADALIRTQVELGPNVVGLPDPPAHRVTVPTDFPTVQSAIDHTTGDAIILIRPGTYHEKIAVMRPNIWMIGLGARPSDVVLTYGDSAADAGGTGKSGSVTVTADGFAAENLTIANSWWDEHSGSAEGSQAVALFVSSNHAVLDRVRLIGGQDTLYANSLTCRGATETAPCEASREYFHDCYIEGHVDYIFGDAKAVFEDCELHSRPRPSVMITAQSKHFPAEDSGYYFLNCKITGADNGGKVFFGRPWRDYSTVLFYNTDVEQQIAAGGWSEWSGRLKTSTYREYKSHGPGVNLDHRIVEYPPLTPAEEAALTPAELLRSESSWNPEAEVSQLRQLVSK